MNDPESRFTMSGDPVARFDITIAGEINLDLILYGLPRELPVERELLATDFAMTLGSSSAILAHNMAALHASVGFITCVGQDALGQIALDRLGESGTDLSRILRSPSGLGTGVTVLLPHGAVRRILTYPGTMTELTCADLDIDYLASGRHFHLSSLFLQTGLHPGLPRLLAELKSRGLTISLDTNDDPVDEWGGILDDVLPLIDILMPNEDELLRIAGVFSIEDALAKVGTIVPLIVVKRGARGTLISERGIKTEVPTVAVTPVDTIGAGDSFNAGFLTAYLKGNSPNFCAAAGNVTGALSTQRAGGTEAFRDQSLLQDFLRLHWPVQTERD
ncbi:carbohydrate kinase family protein [Granulicella sp. S190]|uniref:carbohydrate kinase family protein n=1 Tax=Granulicella sp. S190 TaxID=1747226 RepID=UPI0020B17031|nr:carbohydrate kinase family protein [Granulicella sp. S190]